MYFAKSLALALISLGAFLDSVLFSDSRADFRDAQPSQWLAANAELADESQYLKLADIPKLMQQLFKLHVRSHHWNISLLKNAVENYFESFDPRKIYLLDLEVHALSKRSDELWQSDLKRIENGDWELFAQANRIVQKSIWRSRLWSSQEVNLGNGSQIYKDSSLNENLIWARNIDDLKKRWVNFAQQQLSQNLALKQSFFAQIKEHEDDYLFVDDHGKPMSPALCEHVQTVHILKALAASLDSHSAFYSAQEAQNLRRQLEKTYVGVGIWLEERAEGLFVKQVIEGSPAEASGKIVSGDQIIEVNGTRITGLNLQEVMELLQGKEGDLIEFVFARHLEDKILRIDVALAIKPIVLNSERTQLEARPWNGGILGRIALDSFYESENGPSSAKDLESALQELMSKGELKGLILDLRNNTGGFLSQAVKVAGLFIRTGVVAVAKYSDGSVQFWRDTDSQDWYDGPMLILVSRLSASAAEIVAQCLQDYGAALVIGDERTYGKGTIQFHNLLEDDVQSHYKVTVGKYYTVSGRTTQLEGVISDLVVPGPLYDQAIGEKFSKDPLRPDHLPSSYHDTLSDLKGRDRLWFLRHYLPNMQRRSLFWKPLVPRLREESAVRVKEFQKTLLQLPEMEKRKKMEIFQVNEAFRVLQEMSLYQSTELASTK